MSFRTRAVGIIGAGLVGASAIAMPFISGWEGRSLIAYWDPVRIPTICDGITRINGRPVEMDMTATNAQCDDLLRHEVERAITVVDVLVTVPMPDTRRAALGSFVYNVGPENFRRSTLLKRLNAGHTVAACDELRKWVYAKGKRLKGLERRREAERELCLIGTGGAI